MYYRQSLTNALIYITITAASSTVNLFKPSFQSNLYGKKSITIRAVNAWNKIQTVFENVILKNLTTTQIKTLLTKKCIQKYWQIIHLMLMGRLLIINCHFYSSYYYHYYYY